MNKEQDPLASGMDALPREDGAGENTVREGDWSHQLPLGLLLVNRSGNVEKINPGAVSLLDLNRDQVLGESYQKVFGAAIQQGERPQQVREALESSLLAVRRTPRVTISLQGTRNAHLALTFFSRRDASGRPAGWGALIEDQTAAVRAGARRAEVQIELGRKMRKLLASAAGNLKALSENHHRWSEELVEDFYKELLDQLREITAALDLQLDWMAVENQGVRIFLPSPDLPDLIEKTAHRLEGERMQREIRRQLPEEIPKVRVDPEQTGRALEYFFLEMDQCCEVGSAFEVSAEAEGNWVEVILTGSRAVLDSPAGGQTPAKVRPGGQIARQIVRAHGGRVWDQESGDVCQINFRLPIMPIQREIRLRKADPGRSGERNQRILIADPQSEVQDLLKTVMQREGYRVDLALDGPAALDMARRITPDLIILEGQLPGMDGLSLVRSIRTWSQVPILVLASRTSPQDLLKAFQAGADDYVTKPFLVDEVLARTEALLRRSVKADRQRDRKFFEDQGLRIDYAAQRVWKEGEPLELTPIEYRLLAYMSRHRQQVLSYARLIEQAWEGPEQGTRQGLFVHISRLREKLEEDPDLPRFIANRWGVGYVFMPD